MAVDPATVDFARALVMTPTAAADYLIVAPVAVPLIGGTLALFLRNQPRLQPAIAIVVLALLVVCEAALLSRVLAEGPLTMMMGRWLPPFGIAFTVDALGATLALTAGVAGLAVAVFAAGDLTAGDRRFGFYPLLLLLVAGVCGAFCTGDIFNLYVWFEVLLISSFGLIVLGGEPRQLDGAVKYGILNLIATTLFLVTTGYLYGLVGTLNMADITLKVAALPEGGAITTIAMLYLLAFAMKAAAFPLGFWLPASYHTPKIIVGAIFAGLLTKVGVYALIRVLAMLMPGERLLFADVLGWVAALTLLVPALAALGENEIRRTLGWVVIAGIGNMLVGLALGTEAGYAGAIAYAVHSMLAMTAIYLTLGLVERIAGTSSLHEAGGIWRASPLVATLFLVMVLAASGLPPFSGFWPKAMLVRAALSADAGWLAAAILVSGFLVTLALGRVFLFAIWRDAPEGRPAPGPTGVAGPLAGIGLAAVVAILGVLPQPLVALASDGARGLLDPSAYLQSVFPAPDASQPSAQEVQP
jgi:multicomponent Na+:H+ antiporter subunit D